jgi:hypothetical protein
MSTSTTSTSSLRPMARLVEDRFETARMVADAVLYEGYVLYPYRASSCKNQVRFQWGVLVPRAYSEADGSERWSARTECIADLGDQRDRRDRPILRIRVRCLQTQRRRVEARLSGTPPAPSGSAFGPVDALEVDGTSHVEWDEAVDRVVDLHPLVIPRGGTAVDELSFHLEGGSETESVRAADGTLVGRFVRERLALDGVIRVATVPASGGSPYVKVAVTVENATTWTEDSNRRVDVVSQSLVAVHTMLALDGATFVSLLDPPDGAAGPALGCRSEGTYPVLIGSDDVVLSSPIILYDHPEVADQSPGDLYDSLEIDEILALRVMTLTDAEKAEARGTDARAAAIIDRCDALSPEAMGRLHGQMRPVEPEWLSMTTPLSDASPWWDPASDESVDPWTDSVRVGGINLAKGSAVRLHPSGHADAQDMFLDGRFGTVAGVFGDVDGGVHLAVTLDGDPAASEFTWQGRYLYFRPDEVEPIPSRPEEEIRL